MSTMACPQCQTPYEPGAAFCDNCGAALPQPRAAPQPAMQTPTAAYPMPAPVAPQPPAAGYQPPMPAAGGATCAQCGTPLTPGAAFCDNCGAPVGAAPAQPQAYPQPTPPLVYPQPVPPSAVAPPRLIVQATSAQIVMPPGKMEYLIGREDPVSNIFPDVDLSPHGGDEGGVGRKHARLTQQGGQWYLEDLNSINGTWVNNQKLRPATPVALQSGAELRLGRVKLLFYTQ